MGGRRRLPGIERGAGSSSSSPPTARHMPPKGDFPILARHEAARSGGSDVRLQPRQDLFPGAWADEGRPGRVLRRRRRLRPPPRAPAADADEALPGRGRRLFLLPEARPGPASGLAWTTFRIRFPSGHSRRLPGRRRRCRTRVDRQSRLHRAAHVALADRRRRATGLPADRPRPDARATPGRTSARSRSWSRR